MTAYTWKKTFLRNNDLELKIEEVCMKELVHGGFNIQSIKKPCWLVFKHTGTNDFCCIGKVDLEHQKLSDVINFENNKTVIRSYRDWNEIMTNYIENVNCSALEKKCAEKILASTEGDPEWCQLRKYWNSLKQ